MRGTQTSSLFFALFHLFFFSKISPALKESIKRGQRVLFSEGLVFFECLSDELAFPLNPRHTRTYTHTHTHTHTMEGGDEASPWALCTANLAEDIKQKEVAVRVRQFPVLHFLNRNETPGPIVVREEENH
jgi:hypothetical protein